MKQRHGAVGPVVFLLLLSGCAGGDASGDVAVPAAVDPDSGVVRVAVTDEELFPVQAARVSLDPLDVFNFTGPDGSFEFVGVPAGTYTVRVEAYGHKAAQRSVDVIVGEVAEARFLLAKVPGVVAYADVRIYGGLSSCAVPLVLGILDAGSFCNDASIARSSNLFPVNPQENWSFLKEELTWQGAHWFTMFTDRAEGSQVALKHLSVRHGPSPIRVSAFPGEFAVGHDKQYYEAFPAKNTSLRIFTSFAGFFGDAFRPLAPQCNVGHDSGCMGAGTAVEARSSLYVSVFYVERPADWQAYTAIPDA